MKRRIFITFVYSFLSLLPAFAQKSLSQLQYWIDSGEKMESVFSGNDITLAVDASSLTDGLHTFYYRVKDSEGMYSPLKSWIVLRKGPDPETKANNISLCQYWIDSGEKMESVSSGNDITLAVDASSLTDGLHTFYYRVKDSEGMYSPLKSWIVLRKGPDPETKANNISHIEYWLDDNIENKIIKTMESETLTFTVDASSLNSGLHKISYCVCDEMGFYCAPMVWLFYKPETENVTVKNIAWLKYWWNDHVDKAVKENVTDGNATYIFSKEIVIPDYAKTDTNNYMARFCYVVGDNAGNSSSLMYSDIEYSDNKAPVSTIEADSEVANEKVVLKWYTVSDVAEEYNVYYSENDQPFVLWLPNTTKTSATFKGKAGMTYRFTVIARDKTGDQEKYDETKSVKVVFPSN